MLVQWCYKHVLELSQVPCLAAQPNPGRTSASAFGASSRASRQSTRTRCPQWSPARQTARGGCCLLICTHCAARRRRFLWTSWVVSARWRTGRRGRGVWRQHGGGTAAEAGACGVSTADEWPQRQGRVASAWRWNGRRGRGVWRQHGGRMAAEAGACGVSMAVESRTAPPPPTTAAAVEAGHRGGPSASTLREHRRVLSGRRTQRDEMQAG